MNNTTKKIITVITVTALCASLSGCFFRVGHDGGHWRHGALETPSSYSVTMNSSTTGGEVL